jgi:DtxR family Mn-dependent transcriptional regulator
MKNQPKEDYLKAILKLGGDTGYVSTSSLARALGIGDGSVTDMIKKLAARDFIVHVPYKGVSLTPEGSKLALKMMRRHRLWEIFLTEHLGYGWDEVHDEAENLEHATSDELESRLSRMLGHPDTDPHGQPVPAPDGTMAATLDRPLSAFRPGDRVKITRVSDDNSAILQHATRIGLSLGTDITVRENREFDGSLVVAVGRDERFISREVAGSIFAKLSGKGAA